MSQLEHETNGALVDATPLFASSLMALYYVLRKSIQERRLSEKPANAPSPSSPSHGEDQ